MVKTLSVIQINTPNPTLRLIPTVVNYSAHTNYNFTPSSGGEKGSLYDGWNDILCGTTQENYSKLIDSLVKKDDYGFD